MSLFARTRLLRELARWHAGGQRPRIWWRDDDARGMSPAFDQLLDIADGLPLSVAVIPHGVSPSLADRLRSAPNVTIGQHGVDHVNRRQPAAGPAADYTQAVAAGPLARRILAGRDTLEQAGLDPVFYAPPWNRVEPVLLEALPIAGYFALSGWKGEGAVKPGLQRLDTHLDLLCWKGGARFRGAARIEDDLRRQLAARRRAGAFAKPIGLLTHHLDHDEACWTFLDGFLRQLRLAADFARFDELVTD
jgi:peptidoglycan/xylan/chitin deacetylase (PgdA/CDA1 family)